MGSANLIFNLQVNQLDPKCSYHFAGCSKSLHAERFVLAFLKFDTFSCLFSLGIEWIDVITDGMKFYTENLRMLILWTTAM